MTDRVKLLNLTFVGGGAITMHPNTLMFAMPNPKNLMHTIIRYAGDVSGEIPMPHVRFARMWQAAIEGREIIEAI